MYVKLSNNDEHNGNEWILMEFYRARLFNHARVLLIKIITKILNKNQQNTYTHTKIPVNIY